MNNVTVEKLILSNLIGNEEYVRRVLPFLSPDYFQTKSEKLLFEIIHKHIEKYNVRPTKEAIILTLSSSEGLREADYQKATEDLSGLDVDSTPPNIQYLLDTTEKFCKDKALYNAIMESITIMDESSKNSLSTRSKNEIPELLSKALGVSFEHHVGHDYIQDVDMRYDFYHRVEEKIPFDLDLFNQITNGGLSRKTLNIAAAGTGVGKSAFMCHHAASCLSQNKHVLYITCEMSEERIAERIDANLMNISMDDLKKLPREMFMKSFSNKVTSGIKGQLIIKEYPTSMGNVLHFKSLLDELKLKKDFVPDIVFIDYLNICSSVRFKPGANVNSYTYVKAIAEELRGFAVQNNVPVVTATQLNREGFKSSDVGLENTSESFGTPATADLMFALVSTEDLEAQGRILIKQLKNRYADVGTNRKFLIGVDRSKMKFYDLPASAQATIIDTGSDKREGFGPGSDIEEEPWMSGGTGGSSKPPRPKFDNWKV